MNWILIAFLEPVLHALANILDSNLINRLFKNAWALTVFIAVSDLILLPLIWLIDPPQTITLRLVPFFLIVAFIELFYTYPYYKALQNDDTSVAISLFSLGKIFVPIFAFFLVGESLALTQYIGFLLIVFSSVAITLNRNARFRLNKSFFYMLLSSSLLAIEVVIYKYIFNEVSWGTGFVWSMALSAFMGLASLLVPKVWRGVRLELPALKKHYRLIFFVGIIGFFGNIGFSYAISQVPATVSRTVSAFQPFFVLLYAIMFMKYFPGVFKEEINLRSLLKKTVLFVVTVIGIILAVR